MTHLPSRLALLSLLAAGCYQVVGPAAPADTPDASTPPERCPAAPGAALAVTGARMLGRLDQPARVASRVGSTIETHLGARWVFAELGLRGRAGDPRTRLNAALATPRHGEPTRLVEALDRTEAPAEALPYLPGERAGGGATGDDPLGLWPTSIAVPQATSTLVFYSMWRLHGGFLGISPEGVAVARFTADGAPMQRTPTPLFRPGERAYSPVAIEGDAVYLASCTVVDDFDAECRMARAPRGAVDDRATWRHWDGAAWTADPARAAVIARGMNGFTLSFNRHLGRWVAVSGEILGNRVFARTAARPEGPYDAPVVALETPRPAVYNNYAVASHPALSDPAGCSLVVSWYTPQSELEGETRLAELTFR